MEEEFPSFDINFEFLEPDVEDKNKTDLYEMDKEVEVSWDKLVMQCYLVVYHGYPTHD